MSFMRPAFRLLSPPGPSARLSVLIFHRVLARQDAMLPDEMHAARFAQLLGWIKTWFQVLPLDEAVQRLRDRRLPARAAAITFDDGYADNHDVALPLLEQAGLSATFFIATGFLNGGRMWNDTLIEAMRLSPLEQLDVSNFAPGYADLPSLALHDWHARKRAAMQLIKRTKYLPPVERQQLVDTVATASKAKLPDNLMMSTEQLRAMHRRGMVIGGHTVNHPILARLSPEAARAEISEGRATLQSMLDAPIRLFAYPNGKPGEDYLPEHVGLVRDAGFEAAVTTSPGAAGVDTQPYEVPRFTPWDSTRTRFGLRMARNLM